MVCLYSVPMIRSVSNRTGLSNCIFGWLRGKLRSSGQHPCKDS